MNIIRVNACDIVSLSPQYQVASALVRLSLVLWSVRKVPGDSSHLGWNLISLCSTSVLSNTTFFMQDVDYWAGMSDEELVFFETMKSVAGKVLATLITSHIRTLHSIQSNLFYLDVL